MSNEPIPLTDLAQVLGLGDHEHIAIVGGGGKTTTLHALADQLSGSRVVTTTTKMGHDQHRGRKLLLGPTDEEIAAIGLGADAGPPVVAWGGIEGTKAIGIDPETCDRWFGLVDHVLVEADGARRRPFKAPGSMEPVVPPTATVVVVVMGVDALGRVIGDQCHRPLRVAALAGCQPFERLTPERAATVLVHERGFVASRPIGARMAVVVTKVSSDTGPAVDRLVASFVERRAEHERTSDIAIVPVAGHWVGSGTPEPPPQSSW
ncbi:MAG: selenium cofactor biosynthesis protein YqeC [Acidimicrobiia bacterium]|nr:selenium cofactor biosynthesis protein YqeC [Acidimicrobiia bacterium]